MGTDDTIPRSTCLLLDADPDAGPCPPPQLAALLAALHAAAIPAVLALPVAPHGAAPLPALPPALQLLWRLPAPPLSGPNAPRRLDLALQQLRPLAQHAAATLRATGADPVGCLPAWPQDSPDPATDPAPPAAPPIDPALIRVCAEAGLPWILGAPFESDRPGEALRLAGARLLQIHGHWPAPHAPHADPPHWTVDTAPQGLAVCRVTLRPDLHPAPLVAALQAAGRQWLPLPPRPGPAPLLLSDADISAIAQRIGLRLHPLRLGPRWLTIADQFAALTQALADRAAGRAAPHRVPVLHGPPVAPLAMDAVLVDRRHLLASAARLATHLSQSPVIPAVVPIGEWVVTPGSFLVGLAAAWHDDCAAIKLPPGPLPLYDATRAPVRRYLSALRSQPSWQATAGLCQCWTASPDSP